CSFVKTRRCSFCGFSEHLFTSEFMIGLLSGHRELVDKQKTARPSRRGGFSRPVEILFGEFARPTSGGTSIPTQSTVASTARLLDSYLESLLMSTECYRDRDYPATRILCHRVTRSRTALNFSPLPLAQSSNTAQLLPATQARGRCCRASAG